MEGDERRKQKRLLQNIECSEISNLDLEQLNKQREGVERDQQRERSLSMSEVERDQQRERWRNTKLMQRRNSKNGQKHGPSDHDDEVRCGHRSLVINDPEADHIVLIDNGAMLTDGNQDVELHNPPNELDEDGERSMTMQCLNYCSSTWGERDTEHSFQTFEDNQSVLWSTMLEPSTIQTQYDQLLRKRERSRSYYRERSAQMTQEQKNRRREQWCESKRRQRRHLQAVRENIASNCTTENTVFPERYMNQEDLNIECVQNEDVDAMNECPRNEDIASNCTTENTIFPDICMNQEDLNIDVVQNEDVVDAMNECPRNEDSIKKRKRSTYSYGESSAQMTEEQKNRRREQWRESKCTQRIHLQVVHENIASNCTADNILFPNICINQEDLNIECVQNKDVADGMNKCPRNEDGIQNEDGVDTTNECRRNEDRSLVLHEQIISDMISTVNTQRMFPVDVREGASDNENASQMSNNNQIDEEALNVQQETTTRARAHMSARNFVDSDEFQCLHLPMPSICCYCGAKLFVFETATLCCNKGKIRLPIVTAPDELMQLYIDETHEGKHFKRHIRSYNHVFSFTSMGVKVDEELANARRGIYTFRAQGAIYHKIGSLLPVSGERPRYLQMYIYDTDHEIDNRMSENEIIDRSIVEKLKTILDRHNPFVNVFRQLAQRPNLLNCKLIIKEERVARHEYNLPTATQVAAIIVGYDDPGECLQRDIIVQTQSGQLHNVPDTAGYYDPLQYPLLYPFGNYGWDMNITPYLSCCTYYSYMLQIRDGNQSPFLHAGRLLQQFVVDLSVKIETQRLRYIRNNQSVLRAELYQGLHDSLNSGETSAGNVGRRTVLPSSFVGSPRDKYNRYQDAMALVQKYGKPDFFITMTCNPTWEEINRELLPGQQAQDRPDLTTRVFRAKYEELKKDIFHKGVLGRVISHVHVVEFQKRGLPHCHILVILNQHDKLNSPDEYNEVVRAEIPYNDTEPGLYNAVLKHMIHGPCGSLNPRSPCMKNGCCKKKYPKEFAAVTLQGLNSYPTYRRRDDGRSILLSRNRMIDNRWVVPYNPWLLRKYDCHINVEICSSILSVKYLYKYVNKGNDRASLEIHASDHHYEIRQHVDGRYVCPQEAFWKIFKFPLNKIHPSVIALQVHLPNRHQVMYYSHEQISDVLADERNSISMLTEFFKKNEVDNEARKYLYREFPEHYRWIKRNRNWQKRITKQRVVGRIYTVSPFQGDRYYLRILLNHVRGPTSFNDLLKVNNVSYLTFKQAAEERGLLEGDNSIRECLMDATSTHMPSALRRLFVTILIYCEPVGVRRLWEEFNAHMSEDYPSSSEISPSTIMNHLLQDLERLLMQYEKHITDYDLPRMVEESVIYEKPKIICDEEAIPIPPDDLNSISKLNADQMNAFNAIIGAVEKGESSIFFIDGPRGTGKTFLYRIILAHLRNQGLIAIATASSGIASTILPGGRTAHSRFKIPINVDSTPMCFISKQSDTAELLRRASVLIWDEAPMIHRHAFEALDRTLRDITCKDLPFGGKIFILGGDFRQVLPVVPRGTKAQTINASIVKSPIWSSIHLLRLKQNMRAKNDTTFSKFLLRVGDGKEHFIENDMIKLPNDIIIPWENETSINQLIEAIYPSIEHNVGDKEYIVERALLAPTNDAVDKLNSMVISTFPGSETIYYSFDSVEDDLHNLYQQEFLNSITPGGLPLHELILKEGTPIILLRNIDPSNGLCNGTRLLCRAFHRNLIDAEVITGHFSGTRVFLPRIPLKPSESIQLPFKLTRKQFPVRLAFALTINKAQGQTIPHVGIYLSEHVFSHGQLYVALSRAVSRDRLKILVRNGEISGKSGTHTKNVVYKDVLLSYNTSID